MHARERATFLRGHIRPDHGDRQRPAAVAAVLLTAVCVAGSAPAVAGTIYWDMQTVGATSSTALSIAASALLQGNSSVTGTSATSPSTGYSFLLNETSTTASGSSNLQFRTVAGSLSLGTSGYVEVTVTNTGSGSQSVVGYGFGSRSTATGPQAYSLIISSNAFSTYETIATGSLLVDSVWAYQTLSFERPLSLAPNGSLALRLYAYGGTSAANGNWRIDDVQVTFVPEPGAAGLIACTLVACVAKGLLSGQFRLIRPPSRT